MAEQLHPASRRVAAALADTTDPVETLAAAPGADLTSFLLDVQERRAARTTSASLVRRARTDRLVEPARLDARALHRTIAVLVAALPEAFEVVELAPVAPLGTCSTVATVHQHKVVSAVRNVEVAADPTNALALLAAAAREDGLRRDPVHVPVTRLAAVQRVLRTQPFGPVGQQHFTLLGLVTAGRDRGARGFERSALVEQLGALVSMLRAATPEPLAIRLTELGPAGAEIASAVRAAGLDATVLDAPERTSGRGYYRDLCFTLVLGRDGAEIEIGDGGFTDWTARLLGNAKERLLVAGLGVDRLAARASG